MGLHVLIVEPVAGVQTLSRIAYLLAGRDRVWTSSASRGLPGLAKAYRPV